MHTKIWLRKYNPYFLPLWQVSNLEYDHNKIILEIYWHKILPLCSEVNMMVG